MSDLTNETILTLAQAATKLPSRRAGRKPNASTLYRWSNSRCKDEVLESLQIGGTRCTRVEALQRFFERLSQRPKSPAGPPWDRPMALFRRQRSAAQRAKASPEAARRLEQLGA